MAPDPADPRRARRGLRRWRLVAILAILVALVALFGRRDLLPVGPHIARVTVSGMIGEDSRRTEAITALAGDTNVRAVLLVINSPGGSVGGGESLHDAVAYVAAVKPVVAVMQGVAASAAYMMAAPATRIVARPSTLTGSIGVFLQTGDVGDLLSRLGIQTEALVSGPLKDQPNFFHGMTPQGRQVMQGIVNDLYDQFVTIVATGRHMTPEAVRSLADGRAYTGRQALPLGLVDRLGEERDARVWLATAKGIPLTTTVVDVHTRPHPGLVSRVVGVFGRSMGEAIADGAAPTLLETAKTLVSQRLTLDGAWALWQLPPSAVSNATGDAGP